VSVRQNRGDVRESITTQSGDGGLKVPVTILSNNGTSGAAEIFMAALTEHKVAEGIGERTSGRAAVQKLVKLPDGSALWLSSIRFLTPGGEQIHGKGLTPAVQVDEPEFELGGTPPAEDPILQKALEKFGAKKAA
jgi:carboxyl-terminal processing protease